MRRTIFYVSDGTGITAETIGHSVLTQFDGIGFDAQRLPFVDTEEKAHAAAQMIRQVHLDTGTRAIVVNTVIDSALSEILSSSGALMMDVFAPFIAPLEKELNTQRSPKVGRAHGVVDSAEYEARIQATNYALAHDDGMEVNFSDAEVILLGVSRSGKTPTCLYMALHYGLRAANYPLTDDDLEEGVMPRKLASNATRSYGLTIDPRRLVQIREARRPGSRYASLQQCQWEVMEAERLYRRYSIPFLNTTSTSIEEIASKIMQHFGLRRQLF